MTKKKIGLHVVVLVLRDCAAGVGVELSRDWFLTQGDRKGRLSNVSDK